MKHPLMKHPLMEGGKYHNVLGRVDAIETLELTSSREELLTWCTVRIRELEIGMYGNCRSYVDVFRTEALKVYHEYLTNQRSVPDENINEDLYNECMTHPIKCGCRACVMLNLDDDKLEMLKKDNKPLKHNTDTIDKFVHGFNETVVMLMRGYINEDDFKDRFIHMSEPLLEGVGAVSKGQATFKCHTT